MGVKVDSGRCQGERELNSLFVGTLGCFLCLVRIFFRLLYPWVRSGWGGWGSLSGRQSCKKHCKLRSREMQPWEDKEGT